MIRRFGAAALALFGSAASAQTPLPKPKLIVVISVDQFSADLFAEYRSHFTGGMKRMTEGVVFPSGYQSHAATETCPGHSTILTGDRPARTGIIANTWIDQNAPRADKNVYCAEDERVPRSTSSKYTAADIHLRVPTLGERMRAADPRTRVVSVAGKDRAAIMMGGHKVDQLWYWNGKTFAGSSIGAPAAALAKTNRTIDALIAKPAKAMALSAFCATRARAIPVGKQTIGAGRFERAAGDAKSFRATPALDTVTLGLAADLIDEMKLGKGDATDIISIGASSTDYVGHAYGTEGSEMCIQMAALDASLATLFKRLDRTGVDYVVALTADHGGHDAPERNREHAIPEAARVDIALNARAIGAAVGKELGLEGPVLRGAEAAGDVWIDNAVPANRRKEVVTRSKALLLASPQVAAVFSADDLRATAIATTPPETWTLAERARASFADGRSGDLVVLLKPRVTPIAEPGVGYVATHGSPYDYDRRVPILFWRKGIVPFEQPGSIETVDIAPTLAAMIGFPIAAGDMDGRCRDLDAGTGTTCP